MIKPSSNLVAKRVWMNLIVAGVMVVAAGIFAPRAEAMEYQPLNGKRPKDFAIIREKGVWHVFAIYCTIGQLTCQDPYPGLMHLTSTDLKNWTEQGYVIPPGPSGSWDSKEIWAPSVVKHDGQFYMFYTGVGVNASGIWEQQIGLATSTNLTTWTKFTDNPVMNCGDFSWTYWNTNDGVGMECRDPFVTWDQVQQQWVMFFTARSTDATPFQNPATIGIATSTNLIDWQEYGHLANTNWWKAESPHVFQRDGTYYLIWTDDCSYGKCLKYATSTNLYDGYSGRTNLPTAKANEFASEYVLDQGREYFAHIANFNYRLDFDELAWPMGDLTIQEISYGSIGDYIWNDIDQNGSPDPTETGMNNVLMKVYLDDGDEIFLPYIGDSFYQSVSSGDNPYLSGLQSGYFQAGVLIPGRYWVHVDSSNYQLGGALVGMQSTTGTTITRLTVGALQSIVTHDVGMFAPLAPPGDSLACRPFFPRFPRHELQCIVI